MLFPLYHEDEANTIHEHINVPIIAHGKRVALRCLLFPLPDSISHTPGLRLQLCGLAIQE